MKERLRDLASRLLVGSGATRLGRHWGDRDGTFVFYGHRVADDDEGFFQGLPPRWLRDQLAYLTRHYEVIPLRTLVACIEEGHAASPDEIRRWMSGNICRCGAYANIVQAIDDVARGGP